MASLAAKPLDPVLPRALPRRYRIMRSRAVLGVIGTLVLLGLWELALLADVIPRSSISGPWPVARSLVDALGEGAFWSAIWSTLSAFLVGLGITIAVAVPLGLLLGSIRWVWLAVRPTVEFLRPVPPLAIIPIVILADGTTTKSKVILIIFGAIWVLLVQSMYGIRNVDPVAIDTARVFGLGRARRFWHIILPSALPYVATGIRIASAIALITAISVELLVGIPGLGEAIATAEAGGDLPRMYALIVAAGVLGFVIQFLFSTLERRVMRWNRRAQLTGSGR